MQSDVSFVTNPYAVGTGQTPPPGLTILPPAEGARRTPSRPPGLAPINIGAAQSAASFLLPPLNFVPMAKEHFETAQALAMNLLSTTHALRLSVSLEHSAFLWDCVKDHDRARRLARRTIKEVYSSQEGLDDDEFADASALVQALGGIVRRGSAESTPRPGASTVTSPTSPNQRTPRQAPAVSNVPPIDRTIAVSPQQRRNSPQQHRQASNVAHQSHIPRIFMRTPERLSTVPEAEGESTDAGQTTLSPPASRLSSRSHQRRTSSVTSAASDKASKRKLVEQAEEKVRERQRSTSNASQASASSSRRGNASGVRSSQRGSPAQSNNSRRGSGTEGSSHSRQPTPTEGTMRPPFGRTSALSRTPLIHQRSSSIDDPRPTMEMDVCMRDLPRQADHTANLKGSSAAEDRREAIRRTLKIISAVSKGLHVPASAQAQKQW
ncbi:hypothetical protein HII31_05283, partial [Pseudocercospora fuligena]